MSRLAAWRDSGREVSVAGLARSGTAAVRLLRARLAQREAATWRLPRILFGLLLLMVAVLAVWVRFADLELAPEPATLAARAVALWLLFLAPWAALVRALRATVRFASRAQSTAEILTG